MDEAHEALLEVFEEMEGQLDKEVARLQALKTLRLEDPGELDLSQEHGSLTDIRYILHRGT